MGYKMKGFSGFKSSPAKQKDFNKTGSKASTTPGHSTTKLAKKSKGIINSLTKPGAKDGLLNLGPKNTLKSELKRGTKQFVESAKGQMKGLNPPKVSSRIVNVASKAGKVARFVGKAASYAAVPLILHDMYKSGQKHSGGKVTQGKATAFSGGKTWAESKAEAKKKTKSIFNKKK